MKVIATKGAAMISEIIVDQHALDALVRMGDLSADMVNHYTSHRDDGRYNLRVSQELRQKLDRILIQAGTGNHSDAILAIDRLSRR